MPMNRRNTQVFHRRLYSGQLEKLTLLKRNDDQQEGTVVSLVLFQCRRGAIDKTGEAIHGDMTSSHSTQWLIPCVELRRVKVNYLNTLDRLIDKFNMWWQPEATTNINLDIFDNFYVINTLRIDPPDNQVLLGVPGVGL